MSNEKYDKAFISYIDDNGKIKDGFFNKVEVTDNYVAFDTPNNRLSLPWNRIIKVKGPKDD